MAPLPALTLKIAMSALHMPAWRLSSCKRRREKLFGNGRELLAKALKEPRWESCRHAPASSPLPGTLPLHQDPERTSLPERWLGHAKHTLPAAQI